MYVYIAIFLAGLVFGGSSAWKVQTWRHDSAALAAADQQREADKMRRQAANTAAATHEADKIVIRTEFVPIKQEVERVVIQYRDLQCLASDGLRAAQSAIARANGDTAKPGDTVPAAAKPP